MADGNRVQVKIFGQDYTIAGSTNGNDIKTVANYVDTMMKNISGGSSAFPTTSLAVLTAVNIANDYYEAKDKISELEGMITNLQKDANHYIQLWEDAKASFKQYKEDAQTSIEQLQELQRIFNLKNVELNNANEALKDLNDKYEDLKEQMDSEQVKNKQYEDSVDALADIKEKYQNAEDENTSLKSKLQELENSISTETEDATEMQKKYKELETNFFDIQMENIQLKNELDKMKKM